MPFAVYGAALMYGTSTSKKLLVGLPGTVGGPYVMRAHDAGSFRVKHPATTEFAPSSR